jgi:predicted DNA-binding transcriptional regulator AlpA
MSAETEWVSTREAMALTGYSQDHLYWLVEQNRVKHRRISNKFLEFDKADLLRHQQQMERFGGGPRRKQKI